MALGVLFVAVCAVAATADDVQTPGTQTILLVKGGYGVGASLMSSSARTTRLRASAAPPLTEAQALLSATKTASALTQELQSAVHAAVSSEEAQHTEHMKVIKLSNEVSDNEVKLHKMDEVTRQNAELKSKVAQLTKELEAMKEKTAKSAALQEALTKKNRDLEQDIEVSSKAWKAAAEARRGSKAADKTSSVAKVVTGNAKQQKSKVSVPMHKTAAEVKKTKAKAPAAPVAKKAPATKKPIRAKSPAAPKTATKLAAAPIEQEDAAQEQAEEEVEAEDEKSTSTEEDTSDVSEETATDVDSGTDTAETEGDASADTDADAAPAEAADAEDESDDSDSDSA